MDLYKLNKTDKVAVIGYGSWATAIVSLLVNNEKEVGWYVRNPEVLQSLKKEGVNPKYLSDVEFRRRRIRPSGDINEVVRNAQIIILAMPSAYMKDFLAPLTVDLSDKFIISAIKGIIPGEYQTPAEYLHDCYGVSYKQIGIISGPSHAEEVGRKKLSYLTIVCTDRENAKIIGDKIRTDYINLSYSADIYGIEYAAIMKNIYALCTGVVTGLGYGDNFRAVLIAHCAQEMTRFISQSYPDQRDTMESAYLGDLLVTCYSTYSRNRRLGLLIGRGCSVKSALNEMTMIAEGYFASECIRHINARHGIEMPIAETVYRILYERANPRKAIKDLIDLL